MPLGNDALQIQTWIAAHWRNTSCIRCGNTDWATYEHVIELPARDGQGAALSAVVLICQACAHMEFLDPSVMGLNGWEETDEITEDIRQAFED